MPRFNVMENYLVPKHTILTSKEQEKVLADFNTTPSQLPQIPLIDPCAKAIGAKAGDIIKIERESPTAGTSIYYRLVVAEWSTVDE
ncbi:MAG: DNA-directed RNA polymerase subunit H [Candidatus Thermoplasmatota archaeon]|jgi:DNA-directed RNA polymerase subunit H|nr:DNA-directed RNA polymerase subunit H [Candidatus Thermoplasmatota archaeon]